MQLRPPTKHQKSVLVELPDSFTHSDIDQQAYDCVYSSFRRRGWVENVICSDPGNATSMYKLTEKGKADRAKFILESEQTLQGRVVI